MDKNLVGPAADVDDGKEKVPYVTGMYKENSFLFPL
jgi:hypothetical protein